MKCKTYLELKNKYESMANQCGYVAREWDDDIERHIRHCTTCQKNDILIVDNK